MNLPDGCQTTEIPGFRPQDDLPACSVCHGSGESACSHCGHEALCTRCMGSGDEPEAAHDD